MTDQPQMIPADKVRDLRDQYARLIEDAGTKEAQAYYGLFLGDLESLIPDPPRPTLADMFPEERHACRWMQADVDGITGRWLILNPYDEDGDVEVVLESGRKEYFSPDRITSRPDLPRMEWPGTEKPAPAPALPEGWRLADHPDHGRVIVTNSAPDADGYIYFVYSDDEFHARFDWNFCRHDELTYIDTAPAPNPLTEGSVWDDAFTLTRACGESGRDQIAMIDKNGDVGVWDAELRGWRVYAPNVDYAPYTIIHIGREADQ